MGRRNKNTFSKALGHLKSRKIDEKLQMLSERPANSTAGYMTAVGSQTNPDFVSDVPNNMGHRYQRGDLNLNQLIEGEYPMITTMGGKNGEMQITNVDKSQYTCCVNQHGVVMNSKYGGQGFGQIRIKPYDHAISGSTVIIKTSSEEESNKLADYLRSDEVHQMVLKNRIVNTNSKELFRTIPDIL